jgi:tRNA-specific 2-thiouridylase
VFYDAASGQARVLGGGFIQSATARRATAQGAVDGAVDGAARATAVPRPLIEAMRG